MREGRRGREEEEKRGEQRGEEETSLARVEVLDGRKVRDKIGKNRFANVADLDYQAKEFMFYSVGKWGADDASHKGGLKPMSVPLSYVLA